MQEKKQTILALDTATHCGYAVYKNGEVVDAGVWDLERKTDGTSDRYRTLYRRIASAIERHRITHIVKEAVYLDTENHTKDNAFKVLCEFGGVVKLAASMHGLPAVTEIQTKKMQYFMLGKLLKRDMAKQAMCNQIERLGYKLPSRHADDEADALGLLFTYLQKEIPCKE